MSTSDPVEILGTMEIIEHLAGTRKQRLHVFPNPIGPITDDTKPHRLLGNQGRVFELLQGLSQIVFALHLVPAQHMNDAVVVQQVEAKAFGLVPRVPPRRMTKLSSLPVVPTMATTPGFVTERKW